MSRLTSPTAGPKYHSPSPHLRSGWVPTAGTSFGQLCQQTCSVTQGRLWEVDGGVGGWQDLPKTHSPGRSKVGLGSGNWGNMEPAREAFCCCGLQPEVRAHSWHAELAQEGCLQSKQVPGKGSPPSQPGFDKSTSPVGGREEEDPVWPICKNSAHSSGHTGALAEPWQTQAVRAAARATHGKQAFPGRVGPRTPVPLCS